MLLQTTLLGAPSYDPQRDGLAGPVKSAHRDDWSAVRRYADAGLLPPAVVDARTGYRRYDPEQVRTGVLVRVLRELDVPLAMVGEVLAAAAPDQQLAVVEHHWASIERSLEHGRAARYHLARVLGGWEDLLAEFPGGPAAGGGAAGAAAPPPEQPAAPRRAGRGVGCPAAHPGGTRRVRRGRRASVAVLVPPDAREDEHDRVIEVTLPVRQDVGASGGADADAVLPGGELVCTDAIGSHAGYPAVLAAYGAVSQWAHERGRRLLDPPLMVHLEPGHVRVGWRLDPTPPSAEMSPQAPAPAPAR